MYFVVFTLLFVTSVSADFPAPSRDFSRSEIMWMNRYRLLWNIGNDNITVEIQVFTEGWVGFGLSPNGDMTGSDIVTAWINEGEAHLQVMP